MLSKYFICFSLIISISKAIEVSEHIFSSEKRTEDPINDSIEEHFNSTEEESNSRPLSDKDFESGRKLTYEQLHGLSSNRNHQDIINNKDLYEGDIIIKNHSRHMSRNAIRESYLKWRNGIIPYTLSNDYSEQNRSLIARVFEEFHNKTCIRFVPKRWFHLSYINISPGIGCASQVGKVGGNQIVSLGVECMTLGIIQHELIHTMGFWHEQSRADRDDYVRINWDNVEKGMEGNFLKFSWNNIQSLGVEYDYASVMHYGTHAFARGFGSTISPLKDVPKGVQIGQRVAMSEKDIKKINNLYDCGRDLRRDNWFTSLIRLIIDVKNQI